MGGAMDIFFCMSVVYDKFRQKQEKFWIPNKLKSNFCKKRTTVQKADFHLKSQWRATPKIPKIFPLSNFPVPSATFFGNKGQRNIIRIVLVLVVYLGLCPVVISDIFCTVILSTQVPHTLQSLALIRFGVALLGFIRLPDVAVDSTFLLIYSWQFSSPQ